MNSDQEVWLKLYTTGMLVGAKVLRFTNHHESGTTPKQAAEIEAALHEFAMNYVARRIDEVSNILSLE